MRFFQFFLITVTIHRRLIIHPVGTSVLNAVGLGSEALETVKVFNIILIAPGADTPTSPHIH